MQYSKELLDKVRSGNTEIIKNLSPLATVALGLQLQQEAKGKTNETTIDFNKVGQTVQGLNNNNHATKPTGITFFRLMKK
ncbi:hypothetical protein [Bacillus toyonensis]|uniref:hypothetical protein n=1 Tax=Bacillus toyonensis TaxID=155322 RepID=UPI000BEB4BB3|nr:hypothetical protein [Bacillus toyonensis]PDY52178.1 hypothetical protein CON61_16745 [Bacillus toyonensis]